MNLTTRLRRRSAQAWTAYGRAASPSRELRRVLGHATRTPLSARVASTQLAFALQRPRAEALPAPLRDVLFTLGSDGRAAATWLVHSRPNSGRTIVHEIDGAGRLLAVVKIGDAADDALAHEAAVLSALAAGPARNGVGVLEIIDFERDSGRSALRTRLDVTGLVDPPYRWDRRTLLSAAHAIRSLQERLLQLPGTLLTNPVLSEPAVAAVGAAPAHGDFAPWNLFLLKRGDRATFAVVDFELAAQWPANWDATRLLVTACEEHRIRRRDIARAATVLGVRADDVVEYLDVQGQAQATPIDAPARRRILNYANLIFGAQGSH
jgi:hypothetical protein